LRSIRQAELDALIAAIDHRLRDGWEPWPGGYPAEVELALIDAVFSIRAAYGQPADNATRRAATGVQAVVGRWREYRHEPADNLRRIAAMDVAEFERILGNRSKTGGRSKASAVHEAATNLVMTGIVSTADLKQQRRHAEIAYTRVHGLGWVTFAYLCMLLGEMDVKADTWIVRFVTGALGRDAHPGQAQRLLHAAASQLRDDPGHTLPTTATDLDHAIWYSMSQEKGETGDGEVRRSPDR
jgi:hypothetical protein